MELDLPRTVKVNDYHEFDEIVRHLKMFGVEVKYEELGLEGNKYVATFYVEENGEYHIL